jgi:hypothetical protein
VNQLKQLIRDLLLAQAPLQRLKLRRALVELFPRRLHHGEARRVLAGEGLHRGVRELG